MNVKTFVDELSRMIPPDLMSRNMYQGDSTGAKDRRENLLYYLSVMQEMNPSRLLVGEAPGRMGCYLSGVPFTDEYTLVFNPFFKNRRCMVQELMSLDEDVRPQSEATARVVWERLDKIPPKDLPLMWNIYPFHPSTVESKYYFIDDRPNRKPTKIECEMGKDILTMLLECFDIKEVYSVGRTAESILKPEYPNIKYIRHPSRGGANEFRKGINEIYGIQ